MVKNEEYVNLLKSMIACVNHGDYYAVKELSNLKLENILKDEEKINQNIHELKNILKIEKCKNKPLEEWNHKQLMCLVKVYSQYMLENISKTNNLKQLQVEAISIDEFIKKI